MGTTISTLCHSCGFSNEFNFGGGKFSYKTHSKGSGFKQRNIRL